MTELEDKVFLRVDDSSIELVKLLRSHTGMAISELKKLLESRDWIEVAELRGLDHREQERELLSLLKNIECRKVSYKLRVAGEIETKEYLLNLLSRWHDISEEQQMMADFELGEPSIETLLIAKKRMSIEVYKKTLSLVLNEWESQVDIDTLNWARQEYAMV